MFYEGLKAEIAIDFAEVDAASIIYDAHDARCDGFSAEQDIRRCEE